MCRDPNDPTTVPIGFVLDDATPPERFALKGTTPVLGLQAGVRAGRRGAAAHPTGAATWAEFPGVAGKVYRALVIGSRAHRVAVRRMLKRIAAAALARGAAVS